MSGHVPRIGIIGGGKFGLVHLRTFQQMSWDGIAIPFDWLREWAGDSSPAWFLGVHFYDLARWMMKADPVEVFARGRKDKLVSLGIDSFDSISAHVTFANGAQFAFQTSWILP